MKNKFFELKILKIKVYTKDEYMENQSNRPGRKRDINKKQKKEYKSLKKTE
jgi:hypothetical protein